ncbi:hypothetical protein L228DRAFT_149415 [Xylona heveae TC161]|uniref:F-box domain-containing protein n=1 Tax=Xylona heveae (strain CBS 132557 / TC161) TaxID=1328760 RepID=A0A165GJB9_XYLHT|nr:hypothetical protein L228DRAFT_149415 [Xylona heveae TC161]KZF22258.1 hypothetical protein L228DRAFT_149415 [Xylona heveae TC161]
MMHSLQELLQIYPVAESIAAALPLGALLNLSRVNHVYRDILHGFPFSNPSSLCPSEEESYIGEDKIPETFPGNPSLHLGQHQTRHWKNLKSKAQLLCSEPQHIKGPNIRGCVMCSMPVCEACVVRASFGKNENTFSNRKRYLCQHCWASGVPHKECHFNSTQKDRHGTYLPVSCSKGSDYSGDICTCSAKDGWLCLACKIQQRTNLDEKLNTCCGMGCNESLGNGRERRRVCLWCDLPLPPKASLGESLNDYELRHVFNKSQLLIPQSPHDGDADEMSRPPPPPFYTDENDGRSNAWPQEPEPE